MSNGQGKAASGSETDERVSFQEASYDPEPEREITRGALARGLLWLLSFVIGGILLFIGAGRLEGTVLTQSVFPSLIALAGTALGFYFGAQAVKQAGKNDSTQMGTRITGGAPPPSSPATTKALAPAPTVSKIEPNSGPKIGGTLVTIKGTDFIQGATVAFGGVPATPVDVTADGSTLTTKTPSHEEGKVDVTVTNPDSEPGLLIEGFTYTAS
jgi:hypothetical protein